METIARLNGGLLIADRHGGTVELDAAEVAALRELINELPPPKFWRWNDEESSLYFLNKDTWHRVYRTWDCYGGWKRPEDIGKWLEETQPVPDDNDGYYALHVPAVLAYRHFAMMYDNAHGRFC